MRALFNHEWTPRHTKSRGCWITSRWVEPQMDTDEHGSGLREEALTHAIIGAAFEVLNELGV